MQEHQKEVKSDLLMLLPLEERLARRQVRLALEGLSQARQRLERAKKLRREIERGEQHEY